MSREEQMGDMLNAIGEHLANIVGRHPDNTYVYAEVGDSFVASGVFHDVGDKVIYYDPNEELVDTLGALWDIAEEKEKWAVLHYEVMDGKFDARFTYPEEIDESESRIDRRARSLIERYGQKPVIYPDPDEHFRELTDADLAHLDDLED